MPQITSCPDCSKKLRVPDDLIGKKVKCPGCTTMFIAEADSQVEAETPAPKPAARTRSESVAAGPKSGSRARPREDDEEEEEEERPRGRRDEEDDRRPRRDDDNGDRRVRSRRDDEDDRRSPARRDDDDDRRPRGRDDEDEDRRPRSRRDEEDDYDDRRSRRRDDDDDYDDRRSRRRDYYDDEPSPRQQAQGWRKVRLGINLAVMAGWTTIATNGVMMICGGVLLLFGGGMIGSMLGASGNAVGTASSGLVGMGILAIIFLMFLGLLTLTELILRLTGYGMCMAVPKSRRNSAKVLVIIAFSLACAGVVLNYGGAFANGAGSSMAYGGYAAGGSGVGALVGLIALAGYVLWMIFLRSVCIELGDETLAKQVLVVLIAVIVYTVVASSIFAMVLVFAVGFGVNSLMSGGGGMALGGGFIASTIVGGILFLGWLGMYAWYVMTLQKVRDLVDYRADRL